MKAAICYFCFNRVDKVKITLPALCRCDGIEETPIYVISDAAKLYHDSTEVDDVKKYIRKFITEHPDLHINLVEWKQNAGPFISLTKGMELAINRHGRAIRIEDDIYVRKDFLTYMNWALDYYQNDERVFAIGSYNPRFKGKEDHFLSKVLMIYGYGTWKDRYNQVPWRDMYNIFNTIDVENLKKFFPSMKSYIDSNKLGYGWSSLSEDNLLAWYIYSLNKLIAYSNTSYVKNIGFDDSGCGNLKIDKQTLLTFYANFDYNSENFKEGYELDIEENVNFSLMSQACLL